MASNNRNHNRNSNEGVKGLNTTIATHTICLDAIEARLYRMDAHDKCMERMLATLMDWMGLQNNQNHDNGGDWIERIA